MNISDHLRPEAIKVLREAKRLLWDGRQTSFGQTYICYALTAASHKLGRYEAVHYVRDEIMLRLGGHKDLEAWLFAQGYEPYDDRPRTQRTRRRWIDSLIKELS